MVLPTFALYEYLLCFVIVQCFFEVELCFAHTHVQTDRQTKRGNCWLYDCTMKVVYLQCSKSPIPGKVPCTSLWYQGTGESSNGCDSPAVITVTAA